MASSSTQTKEYVPLKLVVNKESNKVLFAEAGKDFVDVLFSFLTLPFGTITRLLQKESSMGSFTIGCLNNLYQSVADLDKDCMKEEKGKAMLLQPHNTLEDYCSSLKLNIDDTEPTKYYKCIESVIYLDCCDTLSTSTKCPDDECWFGKTHVISLQTQFCNGFVKDGATFVITDDLRVMPNSMDITSFGMLQSFGIKRTCFVKEMIVNVTKEKVLDLLKCSLISKSTLTDLFLRMKPTIGWSSRIFCCDVENAKDIQFTIKLVIRKSDGKILYAQGNHAFADLLLSFLTFPLGGVVRMFGGNCSLGSIDALYHSILDLDEKKYFVTKEAKNRIVDPHLSPQFGLRNQIFPIRRPRDKFYCHDNYSITCEKIHYFDCTDVTVEKAVFYLPVDGYVKVPKTYVVTDDLVLKESSPTSVLHLINHFQTPLNDLKEKVINIGLNECLSILKASLNSTEALTNGLGHLVTEELEEKPILLR